MLGKSNVDDHLFEKKNSFAVEMWGCLILRDENSDSADCGCEWSEEICVWTLFYHMMVAVSQFL